MSFAQARKKNIDNNRSGFTLIELLVSIAIIGIMAGMVLYTLAGAQQDSLRNRTRGTIEKINSVILERWEGYRYRSVKVDIGIPGVISGPQMIQRGLIRPRQVAELRAVFVKDMMRMEMPDRASDLVYTPTSWSVPLQDGSGAHLVKNGLGREYNILRNYFNLRSISDADLPAVANTGVLSANRSLWSSDRNASAECLYAVVMHSTSGGGSAIEGFHTSEIGDTDGDGYPEFIDAWGNPISWIRWPAGYASALNLGYKTSSPDAFDPLRTNGQWNNNGQQPWTLVPLIVSAGSDEAFGILGMSMSGGVVTETPYDPYATSRNAYYPGIAGPSVGQIANQGEVSDNVSNHEILLD